MTTSDNLVAKFGPSVNEPALIAALEQIMKIFSMSVDELHINWESYVFSKHDGAKVQYTVDKFNALQSYIQEKLEKKKDKSNVPSTIKTRKIVNFDNGSPFSTPLLKKKKLDTPRKLVSPSSHKTTPHSAEQSLSTNFTTPSANTTISTPVKTDSPSSRAPFQVIESINSSLPDVFFDDFTNPVKIGANFDPKKYTFRTMRQKLLEAADVLDEQIDSFAQIVQSHYNIPEADFGNPSIQSQNQIIAVGRIVPDNPQYKETDVLNELSLALETSRLGGIGKRVSLDLSQLENYALFPGQIVCMKGKNPSGEVFKVDEIVELPYLGAPVSSRDELEESSDLKFMIVNGPYTSLNDLDYSNLEELVRKINSDYKPHVVVMFGPFVDITHPLISQGIDIEVENEGKTIKPKTLTEVFKYVVTPILKKINQATQVILIPSLKDATTKHAAYPQDSFDKKSLGLGKNIKCFPNPSMFQLNEVNIGVSNNDIFKDLKDVMKGPLITSNRFERVSEHVIQQRRFYPSFPGSSRERKTKINGEEVIETLPGSNLDVPYLGLAEFTEIIPDILIIPSELRFFAKVVKNVLVINPGAFMQFNNKGTIANVSLTKADCDQLTRVEGAEDMFIHDIWKRARVDIIKI